MGWKSIEVDRLRPGILALSILNCSTYYMRIRDESSKWDNINQFNWSIDHDHDINSLPHHSQCNFGVFMKSSSLCWRHLATFVQVIRRIVTSHFSFCGSNVHRYCRWQAYLSYIGGWSWKALFWSDAPFVNSILLSKLRWQHFFKSSTKMLPCSMSIRGNVRGNNNNNKRFYIHIRNDPMIDGLRIHHMLAWSWNSHTCSSWLFRNAKHLYDDTECTAALLLEARGQLGWLFKEGSKKRR